MKLSAQRSTALLIAFLLLTFDLALPAYAAADNSVMLDMDVDLQDVASLQRGARLFRNYCLSCHSAAYMRYSRMGEDLGISTSILTSNFIFDDSKVGDTMTVAMSTEDAKRYFTGAIPPDLSVTARSRGADWLYTYLKTFYRDTERPFGVNNLLLKGSSMPHVLWELQGTQELLADKKNELRLVSAGSQSAQEYDQTVKDLVNFMVYLGEPIKLKRYRYGFWTILFLLVFFIIASLLKKEYWRDIH